MSDKIRLEDIVVDPTIQVREVESHTVSKYAAAKRAGEVFPPLVIEKGSNRLVCGNHRYYADKIVFEPSDEVACEFREFKDEAEIIRVAARDNATHGRPLDTWDCKRITLRLQRYGDSAESVAEILGVPVSKVQTWAGMSVVVIGKRGRKTLKHNEPLKHGLEHLAGREITEEQWREHAERDRGVPVSNQARALTRWLENGWIDTENQTAMDALTELRNAIDRFFQTQEKTA